MKNEFNSYFFNELYEENRDGNYLDSKRWIPFFEKVAKKIVDQFNPSTVLDAGCACGYLVAALRDLGVQAYGFDISKFAISTARADIQDYVFVHNITEPLPKEFPKTYDLVITSEVLELLFPHEGEQAISLLCQYSDTIVFSSCPTAEDRTHVNVQLPEYWAELFYNNSFAKNFIFDMTVLSPWCVVYERFADLKKLVFKYEQNMRIDRMTTEKNVHQTINDLMESLLNVNSMIYFEDADGYTEDNFVLIPQQLHDSYLSLSVRIPDDCKSIKFVPVESEYCLMKNIEIYLDNRHITQYETNGEVVENYLLFTSLEPYFVINDTLGRKFLKIHAKFHHLEEEFLQLYEAKNRTSDLLNRNLNEEIVRIKTRYEEIGEELATHDQQIAAKDEEINDKLAIIDVQISTLAEKDELILDIQKKLDSFVEEVETKLAEKDQVLAEKEALLQEKEQGIAKRDADIAEKYALITEKELLIESLTSESESALEGANTENSVALAELTQQRDDALAIIEAQKAELEAQKSELEVATEAVNAGQETALEAVKAEHETALEAMKAEHETALEAVKAELEAAMEAVKAELEEQKAATEAEAEGRAKLEADMDAAVEVAVGEKMDLISGLQSQVGELSNALSSKDETIIEKINEVEEQKSALVAIEADLDNKVKELEAKIEELEANPSEAGSSEEIAEKNALLEEKDALLEEKEKALAEKDAIIDEKSVELNEKELLLMEKTSALGKKESAYAELLPKLEEQERKLAEIENSYVNVDDEMVEKNLQISNLQGRLQLIEGEYESLRVRNEMLQSDLSKAKESGDSSKSSSPFKKKEAPPAKGFSFKKAPKDDVEGEEKRDKKAKATKKEKPAKKEKAVKEKPAKKEKAVKEKPAKKEKAVKEKAVKEKPGKKEKPSKKDKSNKKGKAVDEPVDIIEDDFIMPTDREDFVPPETDTPEQLVDFAQENEEAPDVFVEVSQVEVDAPESEVSMEAPPAFEESELEEFSTKKEED